MNLISVPCSYPFPCTCASPVEFCHFLEARPGFDMNSSSACRWKTMVWRVFRLLVEQKEGLFCYSNVSEGTQDLLIQGKCCLTEIIMKQWRRYLWQEVFWQTHHQFLPHDPKGPITLGMFSRTCNENFLLLQKVLISSVPHIIKKYYINFI